MCVTAFASCNNDAGSSSTATKGNDGPVRTVEDDGLPKLNFNNETIVFITEGSGSGANTHASDLFRDSVNNDVLNDAIYNRTKKVEERLGVKLKFQVETTKSAHDVCNASVLTGLDEYQILGGKAAHTYSSIHVGYYLNLLDKKNSKYLDLNREWWNQYMIKNSTIYDNCSVITGALSLSYVRDSFAMFYGKKVAENNKISTDFYQLVRDGKWTVNKQLEIITGLYSDLTGDGKTMDDTYGLLIDDCSTLDAFYSAFDIALLKRTDDGGLAENSSKEKIYDAVTKMYSMMYENRDVYLFRQIPLDEQGIDSDDAKSEAFANNQALFSVMTLGDCSREELRNMDGEYGILPMPKWDEYQEDYYTFVADGFEVYALPKTIQNVDAVSATLEALAIESYKYVAPAYYNKVLNGRYMSDPDSSEMLDKITTNVSLSPEWVFAFAFKKLAQDSFRYLLRDGKSSFQSWWKGNSKKYLKEVKFVLDNYQKLES